MKRHRSSPGEQDRVRALYEKERVHKRMKTEASVVVVADGEPVVVFSAAGYRSYDKPLPGRQRFNEDQRKAQQEENLLISTDFRGPYSIHGGEFKFFHKKAVGDRDPNGYGGMVGDGKVPDEQEPQFRGEYHVDRDFVHRTGRTRVEL